MYEIHFVSDKGLRFSSTPRFKTIKGAQEFLLWHGFEPYQPAVPQDKRFKCRSYVKFILGPIDEIGVSARICDCFFM